MGMTKPKLINWRESAGMKFGRLTILRYAGANGKGQALVECNCSCGKITTKTACNLLQGLTLSCGCIRVETTIARRISHGHSRNGKATRPLAVYQAMLNRCHGETGHPGYKGRGITVCDRWRFGDGTLSGFLCFLKDMGQKPSAFHTIDRKDNNAGYSPENCRWADRREQAQNRRSNHVINAAGLSLCKQEWTRKLGVYRGKLDTEEVRKIGVVNFIESRMGQGDDWA